MANRYRNQQYSELAFYQQATLHGEWQLNYMLLISRIMFLIIVVLKQNPNLFLQQQKKISVKFNIVNLGSSDQDSLDLRFNHQIPNGSVVDTVQIKVAAPINFSENEVVINNRGLDGLGKNILFGLIDLQNKIDEVGLPQKKIIKLNLTWSPDFHFLFWMILPIQFTHLNSG